MDIRHAVEAVGLGVDADGVAVIVVAIGLAGVAFARGLNRGLPFEASYRGLRQSIGRWILTVQQLLGRPRARLSAVDAETQVETIGDEPFVIPRTSS